MTIQEYIRQAIAEQKDITIEYIKYDGTKSMRTLSNVRYSDEYGNSYITAYCHKRNEERTFKISRIQSVDGISAMITSTSSVTKTPFNTKNAYATPEATTSMQSTQPVNRNPTPTVSPTPKYIQHKNTYTPTPKNRNEGCYIATMAYGDYDHPQVIVLRKFRDEKLLTTVGGTAFVCFYYWISPKLVKLLADHKRINSIIRYVLDGFIKMSNFK